MSRRGRAWLIPGLLAAPAALALGAGDPWPALLRSAEEAARVAAVTAAPARFEAPEPFESRPGGAATVAATAPRPLAIPIPELGEAARLDFALGEALFERLWASSPASTQGSDGLGPLFNARACASCHTEGGRGHPNDEGGPVAAPLVVRLGVPAPPAEEARARAAREATRALARPHPVLGHQIQDRAAGGRSGEPRPVLAWEESEAVLADGTRVPLRRPVLTEVPAAGAALSPRAAPPILGLGLLEAIPAAEILAREDPADRDGDGVSGRAALVWSESLGGPALGRFGWKAAEATLADQAASAFATNLGISSPLRPAPWGDCTPRQSACRAGPHGDGDARGHEIDRETLDLVALHVGRLAVPARRDLHDPEVLRGKALFFEAGCAGCHTLKHVTHRLPDRPELSFQLVWPFTDLLLHDMGEGLADALPEGDASGAEWRTAPLWGLGLSPAVTGRESYLHDGRARTLLEAILWHGGEAQAARDAVAAMARADRAALLRYLASL